MAGNRAYNKHKRRRLHGYIFGNAPNRKAARASGAKKAHYHETHARRSNKRS